MAKSKPLARPSKFPRKGLRGFEGEALRKHQAEAGAARALTHPHLRWSRIEGRVQALRGQLKLLALGTPIYVFAKAWKRKHPNARLEPTVGLLGGILPGPVEDNNLEHDDDLS